MTLRLLAIWASVLSACGGLQRDGTAIHLVARAGTDVTPGSVSVFVSAGGCPSGTGVAVTLNGNQAALATAGGVKPKFGLPCEVVEYRLEGEPAAQAMKAGLQELVIEEAFGKTVMSVNQPPCVETRLIGPKVIKLSNGVGRIEYEPRDASPPAFVSLTTTVVEPGVLELRTRSAPPRLESAGRVENFACAEFENCVATCNAGIANVSEFQVTYGP